MQDRIIIFCGNYGSGKTEIALNTALKLRSQGERTVLVDLDIVNPYFRSSEHEKMLKEHDSAYLCGDDCGCARAACRSADHICG